MPDPLSALPEDPPWVAVDTETSGLFPDDGARAACVSLTWPEIDGTLATLALPFNQGRAEIKWPNYQPRLEDAGLADPNHDEDVWIDMLEYLHGQKLVFHNAQFDLTMLAVGTDHWEGLDLSHALHWDTLLAQRILDPLEPAALDKCTKRLGIAVGKEGLDAITGWLKHAKLPPKRYDLAPWDLVEPYVSTDTELTAQLYLHQIDRLVLPDGGWDSKTAERIGRECDLAVVLAKMEWRGVGYDVAASAHAADTLEERAQRIAATFPFQPTPNGAKSYFYNTLGLQADRYTDKGAPSLDEEQVRKWVHQGDVPFAKDYADYTKIKRAVSMWYGGYPQLAGADDRLRGRFRQAQVKSGRMSIERVQLQAMPKSDKYSAVGSSETLEVYEGVPQIRDMLRAKPGMGLWSLDLSQAELRVAAQYAQCSWMLSQLADGEDIHSNNTKDLLHVDETHPEWKTKRDVAKRTTFGGIFQVGGKTLSETLAKLADIHLPVSECDGIVRRWRGLYPEMTTAYRKAEAAAKRNGYVRLLPNTDYEVRSYFGERDWPHTAWNRIVQGSLAEAFKLLLIGVEERWPGWMILTVHDSVVMEMPLDKGDAIAAEVAAWGSELMTGLFKIPMSIDIDRWDKEHA